MRDYLKSSARSGVKWEKNNSSVGKWKSVSAIFIALVICLATFNGLLKSTSEKKFNNRQSWDGVSSFVVGLKGDKAGAFIFQKDPKRVAVVKFGEIVQGGGQAFADKLSAPLGANINTFLNVDSLEDETLAKRFENFTSFMTPAAILTSGMFSKQEDTNITRIEALRLWWQAKTIRPKEIKFVDLSAKSTPRDTKVLGASSNGLNKEIVPYLENVKIIGEDVEINIVNESTQELASALMQSFVKSVGGRVNKVSGSADTVDKCLIYTNKKGSYTVNYLAKTLTCDINDTLEAENPTMTIHIGENFNKKYFK